MQSMIWKCLKLRALKVNIELSCLLYLSFIFHLTTSWLLSSSGAKSQEQNGIVICYWIERLVWETGVGPLITFKALGCILVRKYFTAAPSFFAAAVQNLITFIWDSKSSFLMKMVMKWLFSGLKKHILFHKWNVAYKTWNISTINHMKCVTFTMNIHTLTNIY